eukprot:5970688-Heterocapsa_arctica.AAC.1
MVTEEMMMKIADIVSKNLMTELHNIEERLVSIENTSAAAKDMTEIGLKEIERRFDKEHAYNNNKFMDIQDDMDDMNKLNNKKKEHVEEERMRTEESEEEEEEQLPGAKAHDMN